MEVPKDNVYRTEGIPVTLRLLSQLPVENLRFQDEADFPGFLKYDFPFTAHPKAAWIDYRKTKYASYELQKFLVFPLKEGSVTIPPVVCELRVRIPTSAYKAADLVFDLERTSNSLSLKVLPVPPSAVVGTFVFKNEIHSDLPQSKTVRLILEGEGELSTFDFPEISGGPFHAQRISTSTDSEIKNQKLRSRKEEDIEVTPSGPTTEIVLPGVEITQFDPSIRRVSTLRLPPLKLHFVPSGQTPSKNVPLPNLQESLSLSLPLVALMSTLLLLLRRLGSGPKKTMPRFKNLFHKKNPTLHISKNAAQEFYRQILTQITNSDGSTSWTDVLRQHLPSEEWLPAERVIRRLESTAFSQSRGAGPTYGELTIICERIEKNWK
jgi:hypothetical protein